jgi:hypothetical protein
MMLSSNALIVVMAQIKGWMFSSEMGWFSDATLTLPKIGGKVGNMIEDPPEEGIAVPLKKWHVGVSCIIPSCPLCAFDDPDELHQNLMEDRWRTVSGGYCHDD